MTRDEILRYAVKILGTPACQNDVGLALEEVGFRRDLNARRTKKGKIAARRLADALRRVDAAMKSDDLFPPLLLYLPHDKLLRWIDHCDAIATRPLGPPKPNADSKKHAANKAYELMQKYDRPVVTTKRSPFEKLAAVLSGDLTADFHHYCRAVVRSAKLGSK